MFNENVYWLRVTTHVELKFHLNIPNGLPRFLNVNDCTLFISRAYISLTFLKSLPKPVKNCDPRLRQLSNWSCHTWYETGPWFKRHFTDWPIHLQIGTDQGCKDLPPPPLYTHTQTHRCISIEMIWIAITENNNFVFGIFHMLQNLHQKI